MNYTIIGHPHANAHESAGRIEHGQAQVGEQAHGHLAEPAPGHNVPVADGQHLEGARRRWRRWSR
jgi:hypothetical protein